MPKTSPPIKPRHPLPLHPPPPPAELKTTAILAGNVLERLQLDGRSLVTLGVHLDHRGRIALQHRQPRWWSRFTRGRHRVTHGQQVGQAKAQRRQLQGGRQRQNLAYDYRHTHTHKTKTGMKQVRRAGGQHLRQMFPVGAPVARARSTRSTRTREGIVKSCFQSRVCHDDKRACARQCRHRP